MRNKHIETDIKTGLPVLRGHIFYDVPGCCQIAVYCPYCKRNHVHGWPARTTDPDYLEHRLSHCTDSLDARASDSPYHRHGYMIGVNKSAA